MSFEEGARNTLEVAVAGDSAAFSFNGAFVAVLDASQLHGASDVWVGAGFHQADAVEGATTHFEDFTVWPIDFSTLGTSGVAQPAANPVLTASPVPMATPVASG